MDTLYLRTVDHGALGVSCQTSGENDFYISTKLRNIFHHTLNMFLHYFGKVFVIFVGNIHPLFGSERILKIG